jgi:hypothetical protein
MRPGVVLPAIQAAGLSHARTRRYGFFPPFLTNRATGRRVEHALEQLVVLRGVSAFQLFLGARP